MEAAGAALVQPDAQRMVDLWLYDCKNDFVLLDPGKGYAQGFNFYAEVHTYRTP